MSKGFFLEKNLIQSEAFKSLTAKQSQIFFHFMLKRQMQKIRHKGRSYEWDVRNNDEIIFPYKEAEKLGFSARTFADAISRLVEVGLIDVAYSGNGRVKGDCSKYGLYDRWEKFGTPDFISKTRPKDSRQKNNFQKHNESRNKS